MTVRKGAGNALLYYQNGDTLPSPYTANALAVNLDTNHLYKSNGASWDLFMGPTKSEVYQNKTLKSTQNSFREIYQNPLARRFGAITPTMGASSANLRFDGTLGNSLQTGSTYNSLIDATEGAYATMATAASSGVFTGWSNQTNSGMTMRGIETKFAQRFIATNNTATCRFYLGFVSANPMPINETPIAAGAHGFLVGFNVADGTWQIFRSSGGAQTKTAISGNISKDTGWHTVIIEWPANGNITVTFDGVAQEISDNLPGTSTALHVHSQLQTSAASARTHSIKGAWIDCEK